MAEAKARASRAKSQYQGQPVGERGEKAYYIVNPGGAVHSVTREHAKTRLAQAGWRMAEDDEIEQYLGAPANRGLAPVAPRWSPDPDAQIELD